MIVKKLKQLLDKYPDRAQILVIQPSPTGGIEFREPQLHRNQRIVQNKKGKFVKRGFIGI
jgi:hypothetical protein